MLDVRKLAAFCLIQEFNSSPEFKAEVSKVFDIQEFIKYVDRWENLSLTGGDFLGDLMGYLKEELVDFIKETPDGDAT